MRDPCKIIIDHSYHEFACDKYVVVNNKMHLTARENILIASDCLWKFLFWNWLMYGRIEHEWKMMTQIGSSKCTANVIMFGH